MTAAPTPLPPTGDLPLGQGLREIGPLVLVLLVLTIGMFLVVWLKRGSQPRRSSVRRRHRPRNPTLAEAGGLPPQRPRDQPPAGGL